MNPANYSEQLQSIYRNILLHQQSFAYANIMAAMSTASTPPPPQIKIEPVVPSEVHQKSPQRHIRSSLSPSNFSLDSEIPRDEIEGDIEVILVKNFLDILKKTDTTLNGLRGKKFGFREVLELTQTRPTYSNLNSSLKRNRTSSFGSVNSLVTSTVDEEEKEAKKPKIDLNLSTCSSDDGRLMIDWEEEPAESKNEKENRENSERKFQENSEKNRENSEGKNLNKKVEEKSSDDYKPSKLRFERLKQIQKKKPRFNIDNLDLTYHSNMARQFPGTENRSQEQQQRRDKNTLAARISRNKNKAYEKFLDQQSVEATVENINLKRQVACLRVYANSLMKMSGFGDQDFSKMFEENIKEMYKVE